MEDLILVESEPLPFHMEILVKLDLFTPDKIRNIHKTRKDFDAAKSNNTSNSTCYLEQIAFEKELLDLIASKCHNEVLTEIKTKAERFITTKINKLYQESLMFFPNEEQIYENFFNFCKFSKQISKATPFVYKFVQLHGRNPQAWITAALWEYKELKNREKGRALFIDALSRLPASKEIYKAFMKAELETLVNQSKTNETEALLKEIYRIYNHCKLFIFDLQFAIDLLEILENYAFSYTVQNEIVRNLTDFFPGEELMWHTLAQRELKGYHVNDVFRIIDGESVNSDSGNIAESTNNPNVIRAPQTKFKLQKRIELCTKIYYKATQIIKTPKMWAYFIDAMIDLNKDYPSKLKNSRLLMAYKSAHNISILTEVQYIRYIDQLKRTPDTNESPIHFLPSVLNRATTIHSTSVVLWSMYLKYFIAQNNERKVREKLDAAIKACGISASLPLWKLYKEYLLIITSIENEKKMEKLFVEAINQPEPISSHFQVEYIEWISFIRNIEYAREIFYKLIEQFKSAPYALYKKMLEINKQQVTNSMLNEEENKVRSFVETINCYNSALNVFGKTEIDIWIDYIKFHRDYGDVKEMVNLVKRAKLELEDTYIESFVFQYEHLQ